jgi:hypothetical protein
VRIIKFWFAPRIRDRLDFLFDSPRLDRVFRAIADHRLGVLVHVSDPDRWFEHKYDPAKYGTKADQYPMLEHRLREHPTVPFLAAHMAGDPEHLDHLADLLTRYPNLYLDTSATKWIVRELGRQRDAARLFFRRWAERICFGTDHVVLQKSDPVRYLVRYWVHQMFWETDLVCPSPIPDPDADGAPMLRGLDLPADVLEQIYWKTAGRAFKIDARRDIFENFPCPWWLFPLRRTYDWNALQTALRLRRLIRTQQVHIVHTFFESSDLWGGLIAKLSGTPVLISSRRDMGIYRTSKHQLAYQC